MRFWRTGSPVPTDGLDPEILALYGDGKPAEIEQTAWDAIGEAYTRRLDGPEAYAAVFPEPEEDEEGGGGSGGGRGGNGGRRAGSSAPARAAAMPAAARERSRTIAERVQAVLDAHDDHLDAKEVLELVNADGGREVKLGSVRNTLSSLRG
ncbi:hypothetical protein VSR01_00240 [Actinacidiphila sp. DG2A-62]|uniref:hypothetical protein n=1 Tax=Actinacidiphila sp. DG2A-62 TaxID=3108821 RepID=UPI002DB7F285|nr:hypothetical protein [Actinacidiphila sp. DG2A-62]MEC3992058.1 hypothetical protein [Actinacidiphila sp. DG2A-62]